MLLPLTTVTALCVLLDFSESTNTEKELEEMFKARSDDDWLNVWHQEHHTRCQETLLRHLYWACEKDIYRLSRRNDNQDQGIEFLQGKSDPRYPFLSVVEARVFLRDRRRQQRRRGSGASITDECCLNTAGCTWEEYAEYCPANKRLRKFV
ncbi:probable insulin-like peptide 7 isoform X2 [Zootermopsis nevadensis]|uniref:Putative insulin-like peptide 7 n=2 Tax=Zootermopsis nevadensis TaxID=136037 RepID=A0A067RF24_ZOONE|nr:probable insulin-like peptide 7 isoform X2 [Zootermopsis nevadensis]XP_021913549.1 probable insulin-like peptide 7 isoform X2 [Zootermopsis nevadensis]XP_021913550.1 probable insulin-like peptide 7 isoform X2 [Zootermopsis nevadensis]KDR22481.1 putative insulin-like peptide 7 [Zootermopsis nevadensis]